MKYAFIEEHRHIHGVGKMAKMLKITRSAYYAYRRRPVSNREQENHNLVLKIQDIHSDMRQVYGSPRVTAELKSQGIKCSHNRVAKLMNNNNIVAVTKRRFKVTTKSKHRYPISPNLLCKPFAADYQNQIWVSDISYIPTAEGWLYLAIVCDLYSRAIVGWSMQNNLHSDLVINAFHKALQRRNPHQGLIFHSDRGVQYACREFRSILKDHNIIQSMSGKGNCYDNAVSESFFGTLKQELLSQTRFRTRSEARSVIFEYLEIFYNQQRIHSSLGYLSPNNFEQQYSPRRLF